MFHTILRDGSTMVIVLEPRFSSISDCGIFWKEKMSPSPSWKHAGFCVGNLWRRTKIQFPQPKVGFSFLHFRSSQFKHINLTDWNSVFSTTFFYRPLIGEEMHSFLSDNAIGSSVIGRSPFWIFYLGLRSPRRQVPSHWSSVCGATCPYCPLVVGTYSYLRTKGTSSRISTCLPTEYIPSISKGMSSWACS